MYILSSLTSYNLLKVLKGSGMEKLCNEYDIKYSPFAPYEVLSTHCLSYDDILLLKGVEEMLEIYYNSNRFYHSIRYLIKFCENPFELFYKLSEYKNKKAQAWFITTVCLYLLVEFLLLT